MAPSSGRSEDKRIADDEDGLRQRKSQGTPTNQPRRGTEPWLLSELRDTSDNEQKRDSTDSYGLKTQNAGAEKNCQQAEQT